MFKKFHLIFGFILFVVFLMTGQYMDRNYNHLADMEDVSRALMRMEHIYILLSSLIHISLGSYIISSKVKLTFILQTIGSIITTIATLMIIYSFFTELPTTTIERPICRMGLYLTLTGILCHGVPNLFTLFSNNDVSPV